MLESLQSALRCSTEKPLVTAVRRRWMAVAALSLLHPALASAMGLGEITLHSALSQPLNAEIALVDPGDLSEGELSVSLATPEEFSRAGVERLFFLNDLRFTPVLQGNRSFIRVQSSKPVSEPFLNFLIQVNRPNGRLLREYTVLLDPPGSGTYSPPARNSSVEQAAPVADRVPPPATQGKRYTVARGDSLWSIARRLNEAGSKASVNELSQGIRALNPGSERLAAGQSLLLPDVAVVPASPPATAAAPATALTEAAQNAAQGAEQLAAATLENQQLQKTIEELQARLKTQDEQIAIDQKQLGELQAQLAELKAKPVAPPVAPAPVVPPVAAAPVVAEQSGGLNLLLLAALAVLLLLLAAALVVRRRRRSTPLPVEPAPLPQDPPMVSRVLPASAAVAPAEHNEPLAEPLATVARRETSEVPDALEGVSIYIAYGRFKEAAGILREAILKEPQRTDLRLRLLDVLAQQGDNDAYTIEEQHLLDTGFSESTLRDLRAKHPKLHAAPAPQAVPAAPTAAPAAIASTPAPAPVTAPAAVAAAATLAAPVLAADWLEKEPEAKSEPEPAPLEDEFQLNLDDLSMDSDWDLVSPFDNALPQRGKAAEEPSTLSGVDPQFASNLNELPHVFEMPDEQFLSDFAEPEPERPAANELSLSLDADTLDDEFLDSFMSDEQPLDIEPLEVDFDSLEREQASASKLEQAQTFINVGDLDHASQLLHELLREGDEPLKQTARTLLASIR
ncbi:FimV/HubP family polar landmark protein [Pseudomonas sp. RHF3.3-3]|uniref:FimV/HubP family polar landmark protein n=1 Tax=Pseudomonas sp. RHF3.3-3 TaxID=3396624 RepID=UPI003A8B7772